MVLPCINRSPLWRGGLQEDQQQVVHWDFQGPGVRRDQANRLLDLYASGEKREYKPLYLSKMHISDDAFSMGDFSLTINDIQASDKGLYSCHLHHHYCGLNERRIFRVIVEPPVPPVAVPTEAPTTHPAHIETTHTPEVMDNDRGNLSFIVSVSTFSYVKCVHLALPKQCSKCKKNAFKANNNMTQSSDVLQYSYDTVFKFNQYKC